MALRGIKMVKKIKLENETILAFGLIVVAILLRLLPHPANFAPVAAVSLFAGAKLNKKYAIWIPLAIMMVSDLFLGLHSTIAFTWGSFALIGLLGLWLKGRDNIGNIFAGALTGSLLFYFVTNFGVWIATPLYQKTLTGLLDCYVMAIPFFRNTLMSDILFAGALFGAYELAKVLLLKNKAVQAE